MLTSMKFLRIKIQYINQYIKYLSTIERDIPAITGDWWDINGKFKPLHSMNYLRIPLIRDKLVLHNKLDDKTKPLENMKLLDIGCGGGIISEPLANLGAYVTGVDSFENVEIAKHHLKKYPELEPRIKYIGMPTTEIFESEDQFDACVLSEVVEHVPDVEKLLSSSCRMLKENGLIFITTINKTVLSKILAIYVAENILRLLPKGIHSWDQFITPEHLTGILKKNGCSVRLIQGMIYNPITNKWHWFPNVSVNYALYAVKDKANSHNLNRNL